ALLRVSRSPLAWPLGVLCLDFLVANAADVLHHLSGTVEWQFLDEAASSLLSPIALRFLVAFTSGRRRPGRWEVGFALYFVALAACCLLALAGVAWARELMATRRWALALLPGAVVTALLAGTLLIRHLRESPTAVERSRARLVAAAFAIGALGNL